ncbi:PREDICTED: pyridoxine-5'-phosphate oxidase-like [Amphimedon queenslandica]|uniref:pyridoxal 5'-phosphate synthase n=1 Tax=Amphimedon queenslandica TaxID=400682 RepID=A0A1X7VP62_AMPQE|nr:PREDICTED: pyridoxine-5'-phosphate oxidase-like [Amphimedon queenslandica]|eukprot:XP_003383415.1 PREDICTED: pyridoxine-5'-phosphate oxidase-like [Amphimedon queenslandica]
MLSRFVANFCYRRSIKLMSSGPASPVKDLYSQRTPYESQILSEESLVSKDDPLAVFHSWFLAASQCTEIKEANAVCLATCSLSGQPSCRMLLMKHYSGEGFKFFTNYQSRKGQDLSENPNASLLFYWAPLHRQVRIEGVVSKLAEDESAVYFNSRPISSQISAVVSQQSSEVNSRAELEEEHQKITEKCEKGIPLSKPEDWGGFVLVPNYYEFWQGHSNRLHDRICFKRRGEIWKLARLAP